MKAFFYDGKYYLLPKNFVSYENFSNFLHKKLKRRSSLTVKTIRLYEIKCMAPYFTLESAREEKVKIKNADCVFAADIELMTQKEYNNRLRMIVNKKCEGCLNFGTLDESDESLNGHHEEINLNGECFFRRENVDTSYHLFFGLESLYENFKAKQKIIENLIDRGKFDLAHDTMIYLIEPKLGFRPHSINFFKQKNTYFCCFPCFLDLNLALIYKFICQFLNSKKIPNWKFLSYLPKGALGANFAPPPPIKFIFNNKQLQKIDIIVPDFDKARDCYLALCNTFGENRFLGAYGQVFIKFETTSYGMEVPTNRIERNIKAILKEIYDKQEVCVPCDKEFSISAINGKKVRSAVCSSPIFFIASDNPNALFSDQSKKEARTDILTEYKLSIGRLSLSCDGFKNGKNLYSAFEKVLNGAFSMIFAKEFSAKDTIFYFLIADKPIFLTEINKYRPIFNKFKSNLTIFEDSSTQSYDF